MPMSPVAERKNLHDFSAFVCLETLPALIERIRPLFERGNRVTIINRYQGPGPLNADIKGSMNLDDSPGRFHPAIDVREASDGTSITFTVDLEHGGRFHLGGYASDGTENEVAQRWHKDQRNATLVQVHGRPDGSRTYIEMTYVNDHGVAYDTLVLFDHQETSDRAEEQAKVIDALAADPDRVWTAADLAALAAGMRYGWRTVEQEIAKPSNPPTNF
jgi:hypothetical protein